MKDFDGVIALLEQAIANAGAGERRLVSSFIISPQSFGTLPLKEEVLWIVDIRGSQCWGW